MKISDEKENNVIEQHKQIVIDRVDRELHCSDESYSSQIRFNTIIASLTRFAHVMTKHIRHRLVLVVVVPLHTAWHLTTSAFFFEQQLMNVCCTQSRPG